MSERYTYQLSSTALMSLMGSIQATVYALCMEKDRYQWKLGWNIRLLTVAFSGIDTVDCEEEGPHFVSIFNPLVMVLVAIAGSFLLNERLHLGSWKGIICESVLSEFKESVAMCGEIGIICESVLSGFKESVAMCGRPNEKLRAGQLLKHLNPCEHMTGKLALKNKVVFGTGDRWHAPTLTANMAFPQMLYVGNCSVM
ncbi:hypothetical protein Dsin_018024 [Dipteronia sinensis]|uniref:WAT1-related protein n=1 Tax=Dipteronia sinensis TaxID=43782 RepID=A0AAE0AGS0_9ROSI|nr:hypothetical protein Dsin_018024 [Dipteronia sinensis]